jgi:DNA replication initiation complex subunit (GINS family)
MEDTIKITLETLYDILRNEKKRDDLQELERTFFVDVVCYLREKKALLDQNKETDNIFAIGEQDKIEYELRSIKRILKEIYEKREKKIIEIAINRSRTRSDIIDTSFMLPEEKEFYDHILKTLDAYRQGVLWQLYKGEVPVIIGSSGSTEMSEKKIQPVATLTIKPKNTSEIQEKPLEDDLSKIKFLHPTPSFIWKDRKVYGPFDKGDETDIFPEVAALLVRKGRAEMV